MKLPNKKVLSFAGLLLAMSVATAHAENLQPYVLAYTATGDVATVAGTVRNKLTAAGFELVGAYAPYPGAYVLGVTNAAMQQAAAGQQNGAFAAVEHVAVTAGKDGIQVSYLNPAYLYAADRIKANAHELQEAMKKALGAEKEFGTKQGRSPDELGKFNYMVGMEHFDDFYRLGKHKSHEAAVAAVDANLKKNVGGAALVYRVDLPGKQQTVFGISRANVTDARANDKHIMADTVDAGVDLKTTAYLPYQIVVDGNQVIAQHMRFRMAVWHPDLTMVTFGKLISSPGAIEDLLKKIAGGEQEFGF